MDPIVKSLSERIDAARSAVRLSDRIEAALRAGNQYTLQGDELAWVIEAIRRRHGGA